MVRVLRVVLILLTLATLAHAETSTTTNTMSHSWYSSPVFTDGAFSGTMFRDFDGSTQRAASLVVQVDHVAGVFDTAIRAYHTTHAVDAIHPNYYVYARYTITATSVLGDWWVGPKINVNFDGWPTEWYENYVVENSSRTPANWADVFNFYGGTYIGETTHDGGVYKHYYVPWETWHQMWAIRQVYRNEGIVSMARIMRKWRQVMPNYDVNEIRFNFESVGDNDMDVTIDNVYAPEFYGGPVESLLISCER